MRSEDMSNTDFSTASYLHLMISAQPDGLVPIMMSQSHPDALLAIT